MKSSSRYQAKTFLSLPIIHKLPGSKRASVSLNKTCDVSFLPVFRLFSSLHAIMFLLTLNEGVEESFDYMLHVIYFTT